MQRLLKALNTPDARKVFDERGYRGTAGTPEEFGAKIKAEIEKYARVIKDANIKME